MPPVYPGHGRQSGSFVPGIARRGRSRTAVSVWTSGAVAFPRHPPHRDQR
jgi:hypothetical protein